MIKLLTALPRKIYVACSGGVDSMAAVDFLRRNHEVTIAFVNHGTETSREAGAFLADYASCAFIPMITNDHIPEREAGESLEEYWRRIRYGFLQSLDGPVVTAHHLDDAVETWVWSSLHGQPKLPSISRDNILRPFMATRKAELVKWCRKQSVSWVDDNSNHDTRFTRNYIRHVMMPHVLRVNPGIHKLVRKRLLSQADKL